MRSNIIFISSEWKNVFKKDEHFIRNDGSVPFVNSLNMNNNSIENVKDPIHNSDAANLNSLKLENDKCMKKCEQKLDKHISDFENFKTKAEGKVKKLEDSTKTIAATDTAVIKMSLDFQNFKKTSDSAVTKTAADFENFKTKIETEMKSSEKGGTKGNKVLLIYGLNNITGNKKFLNFSTSHLNHESISDIDAFSENIGLFVFKEFLLGHFQLWITFIKNSSNSITISLYKNNDIIGNKYYTYTQSETRLEYIEMIEEFNENDRFQILLTSKSQVTCKFYLKVSSIINK